ncbi:MAG: hypothetical protein KDG56_02125, partial [Ottowia sp.]|nr:hypothetical protein [Ottowia sp.]
MRGLLAGALTLAVACTEIRSERPPAPEPAPDAASTTPASGATTACARTLTAEVVALEQAIVLNRLGAFNPAGMLY